MNLHDIEPQNHELQTMLEYLTKRFSLTHRFKLENGHIYEQNLTGDWYVTAEEFWKIQLRQESLLP